MAGWTKEQYDTAYRFRVERYFGGHPNTRSEVVVHYHKWAMQPVLANMWSTLVPILGLVSTDHVCVVGAGFGWGVEALTAETGATTVGIDISDYIAFEQAGTEEMELRAGIVAVGLDPDAGRGPELMGHIFDGQPRANVVVLQNNAASGPQRQAIRTALGGTWPSVSIAENIVDDSWTDGEIEFLRDSMNGFGGTQRLIFIYKGTAARTHQDFFDLLPGTKEVISTDGRVYLS